MFECPLLFPLPQLPPRLGGSDGAEGLLAQQGDGLGRPHLLCYSADYCANGAATIQGTQARD
jgi:hypothetical protein